MGRWPVLTWYNSKHQGCDQHSTNTHNQSHDSSRKLAQRSIIRFRGKRPVNANSCYCLSRSQDQNGLQVPHTLESILPKSNKSAASMQTETAPLPPSVLGPCIIKAWEPGFHTVDAAFWAKRGKLFNIECQCKVFCSSDTYLENKIRLTRFTAIYGSSQINLGVPWWGQPIIPKLSRPHLPKSIVERLGRNDVNAKASQED